MLQIDILDCLGTKEARYKEGIPILNRPITRSDVLCTEEVFETNFESLKGKTRKTPEPVTMKISNLPEVLSCKTFHTKYTFFTAELC